MIDSVNGRIAEAQLKFFRILSQIMQQPGEFSFAFKPQRSGEPFCQRRDIAEVRIQRLPA
jgi:hypothetical protein